VGLALKKSAVSNNSSAIKVKQRYGAMIKRVIDVKHADLGS
jgi:hypothetical protein